MRKFFLAQFGFTLPEILITIFLLGSITLTSFIVVPNQTKKARDAKRKSDLENIKVALYDYFFDADCFPENLPDCGQQFKLDGLAYIENFPCDPNGDVYGYQVDDVDCSQWFKVLANLENEQDMGIEKVGCQYGCGPECEYNYGLASSNIKVNDGCITYYACTPSGECAAFDDPEASRCPIVFEMDPTCQEVCSDNKNRCHDNRGKRIPEE